MIAVKLRTEHKNNPIGIGCRNPLLSWQCEDGICQSAYQVVLFVDGAEFWNSGVVKTNQTNVICEKEIADRASVRWKVRLWDENEKPGEWSQDAYFELGICEQNAFIAQWITPELTQRTVDKDACSDAINERAKKAWNQRKHKKNENFKPHQPASYLRRKFTIENLNAQGEQASRWRLYITCHGLYEAYINGKRVGDYVLTPGCSNYHFELPCQTYDVSEFLLEGENELLVILGDGWYRSTSGVDGDRELFGDTLALFCQLEQDKKAIVCSDEKWEATQEGPLRQNDMQQGEVYDARLDITDVSIWHGVQILSTVNEKLIAMDALPIKEKEAFQGRVFTTPNGETVVDFGQNLAGYVEFEIQGKAGEELRLYHGETLDKEGNFTQENFWDSKRHKENGTYQMISYICKEGVNHYKPRFTIMGFRYAKIETNLELTNAKFTAHAVYSDMEETASFCCDHEDVNQLVQNSIWSQKGNFCDIPTDCPTRERAGWTGDAGLYVGTGLTLMDSYAVYDKWLTQCRYGQYSDGRVANIAPPNNRPGFMTGMLSGSVGWGDACILVPYEMYQRTGDFRILKENYPMMKRWYTFLEKRAKKIGIKHLFEKNPYKRYTLNSGINYGEWCEPGTNPAQMMRDGNYDVATAYFAKSGQLLAEIAEILGEKDDIAHYQNVAEKAKAAFRYTYTENGVIQSKRQCQYIRPIQFGLLSESECQKAAEDLNRLVVENEYHLNTGFLTTPMLCQTLAENGYVDTAYRVLLQDTAPSWLYEVHQGATTLWETWEGDASLNHYSYGAITGWLISGVAGIQYRNQQIRIAPTPHSLMKEVKAVYDSPVGRIVSEWKYDGENWKLHVEIPANATAKICLPNGQHDVVTAGNYEYEIKVQEM